MTEFKFDEETTSATNVLVRDYEGSEDVRVGVQCLLDCAELFLDARKSKAIEFQEGATESMLEMMSILLARAAHCGNEQRTAMVARWRERGPKLCETLIEKVKSRETKILAPDDFAMFLRCPRGY